MANSPRPPRPPPCALSGPQGLYGRRHPEERAPTRVLHSSAADVCVGAAGGNHTSSGGTEETRHETGRKQTWQQWARTAATRPNAWSTAHPALTRASGRAFPETQLGTAVRAAPDAPEERERRELEASTCSQRRAHALADQHTYTRARIHTLFCNRGRGTADAE